MSAQLYHLIEVALKSNLWPILGIVGIILFRHQIALILSNIGSAKKVKVDSSGFTLESGSGEQQEKTSDETDTITDTTQLPAIVNKPENNDWFDKVFSLFDEGKSAEAENFFNEYIGDANNTSKYHKDYPFFLYIKYSFAPNEAILKELQGVIERTNEYEQKRIYIASYVNCLESTAQHEKAIKFITNELSKSPNTDEKAQLTVMLSRNYIKNFQTKEAEDLVIQLIDELKESDITNIDKYMHDAYEQLANIEKSKQNDYYHALCLDKAAEYAPTERETLFSSAYQAAQTVLDPIEISNYDKLLIIDPKYSMAQNNMGVTARKFDLKLVSGHYYTKGEELNNSLSMANIGSALLDAGFYNLAEIIANKALELGNPHENIHHLINRIKTEKDNEFQKWDEIRKSASEIQKNLRFYTGIYYSKKTLRLNHMNWLDNDNRKVTVSLTDSQVILSWNDDASDTKFVGNIKYQTFKGFYSSNPKKPSTLLGSGLSDINTYCLGYFSEKEQQIIIFSESVKEKIIIRLAKDKL